MIPDNFVKSRLAAYAYKEMKGCGYKAMLAVAFVLRNRVRAGWSGEWNACLNTADRFSAFEPRPELNVEITDSDFQKLLADIDEIYNGNRSDNLTEGGLYYYDTLRNESKGPQHKWFVEKIIKDPLRHPRVAQVGMVHIYR